MSNPHIPGQPELPRSEPEIIPPGHDRDPLSRASRFRGSSKPEGFVFTGMNGGAARIRIKRISPFVAVAILFGIAFTFAMVLLLVIGAVLVWIPVAAAVVFGLLAYGMVRGYWRRLRGAR